MSTTTTIIPQWGSSEHADLFAAPEMFADSPRSGLTPEVLAQLRRETGKPAFELTGGYSPETIKRLTELSANKDRVGLGEIECPACRGTQTVYKLAAGRVTGVKVLWPAHCLCKLYRAYYSAWDAAIEKRFRTVTFAGLAPYSGSDMRLSVERQGQILRFVRSHPDDSYLLCGTYGTGKSHLAVGLYQYHLQKWASESWSVRESWDKVYCPVMRATTTRLLKEHLDWSRRQPNDDTPRPSIDVPLIKMVVKQGDKPILILDEIDKLGGNPTTTRLEGLLELVDAVWQAEGTVIATSNRDEDFFLQVWGEEIGGPIIRRITGGDRAHKIRFEEVAKA